MLDTNEIKRAIYAIGIVGTIDGHDVIRRDSVLDVVDQRIAHIEKELQKLNDALLKSCGDDAEVARSYLQ